MAIGNAANITIGPTRSIGQSIQALFAMGRLIGIVSGPIAGVLIWLLPLDLDPSVHKTLAIVGFMLVYWITEAQPLGMTALMGCFLFWILQVAPSRVAFSGFAKPSPWFVFCALLMGEAASRTGLAKRAGNVVMSIAGASSTSLLIGLIILTWGLNFLIPATNGLVVTLAPLVVGIIAVLGLERDSNMAKGLFIIITYGAGLFGRMFLGSGPSILAHGIIAERTGVQVLWSQWVLAFLPLVLPTIIIFWLTIRWLYPPESLTQSSTQPSKQHIGYASDPWTRDERKTLCWLLLAILLWATDFLHHTSPAAIGIGIGLVLALPKIGVLDTQAIKSTNFLLIIFVAGSLSLGEVLTTTNTLHVLTASLMKWLGPLLSEPLPASVILYWGGFLYHFLVGSEYTMSSTLLPILLNVADIQGYNPAAMGMLWIFAGSGKLFLYQATSLILGYSFGFFTVKDLLKVGGILTLAEGLLVMILVPTYWPLIGLPWVMTPPAQAQVLSRPAESASVEKAMHHIVSRPLTHSSAKGVSPVPPMRPDPDVAAWAKIRDSTVTQDFIDFLAAFPATRFAFAAHMRLRQLQRQN